MSNMLMTLKLREVDYQKRIAASESVKDSSRVYTSENYQLAQNTNNINKISQTDIQT